MSRISNPSRLQPKEINDLQNFVAAWKAGVTQRNDKGEWWQQDGCWIMLQGSHAQQEVQLPIALFNVQQLHTISILGTTLPTLTDSFSTLTGLKTLSLQRCTKLTQLPISIFGCPVLRMLDMSNCTKLTTLPDKFDQLPELDTVVVRGCTGLTSLPESLFRTQKQVTVYVYACTAALQTSAQQRAKKKNSNATISLSNTF
eukprot:TRINITY_DN29422_c0_g1_i1.p1 TRINITY_DN29422_c0_g1~~TRINITY_DN29422_c0_g1_i1.p1  ORF type:complete len:200 (-),score=24.91 TRINITY_DN29422_c0_g1_i1:407-1006(-)